MKLLLDTNAYTGLMRGHESVVTAVSEAEPVSYTHLTLPTNREV